MASAARGRVRVTSNPSACDGGRTIVRRVRNRDLSRKRRHVGVQCDAALPARPEAPGRTSERFRAL